MPSDSLLFKQTHSLGTLTPWLLTERGVVYQLTDLAHGDRQTWNWLRDRVTETRYWPLLIAQRNEQHPDDPLLLERSSPVELALLASQIVYQSLQARAASSRWTDTEVHIFLREELVLDDETFDDMVEEARSPRSIMPWLGYDTTLLLIPTMTPWEIPAICGFVAGNLAAETHCGYWHYWADTYQIEPLGIGASTVIFRIQQPPRDIVSAYQVAEQHAHYCFDVVQSVASYTFQVQNAEYWQFNWD